MNRFELQLTAIDQKLKEHVDAYKAIYKKADDDRRSLDEQEEKTVLEHHEAIDLLKDERATTERQLKQLREVEELGRSLGPAVPSIEVKSEPHDRMFQNIQAAFGGQSLGEQFVTSASYKNAVEQYRANGGKGRFSTGSVALDAKGTLLEGAGGGGQAFVSVPQVIPGVVDKLFQSLTFADLILSGQTNSTSLRYIVEGTATSGAAGVAEAGRKPQSTLGLTTQDEPIRKIATILKTSDEMIDDGPAIQSYINGRLTLFVRIEEERQLLRGSAGGNEVQGLLTSRNVPVYAGGTAAGSKAEQVFKAANGMRGSAFLEPDWIVMHPQDWQDIRLAKDTANQYYGGGPFLGPYGGPQGPVSATGQVAGPQDMLWGKPVYVTGVIGAGTAVVGTRAAAQVWRRGGVSVEATNSNDQDFEYNLLTIRAEERLGLAVYRPQGYVEVRLS